MALLDISLLFLQQSSLVNNISMKSSLIEFVIGARTRTRHRKRRGSHFKWVQPRGMIKLAFADFLKEKPKPNRTLTERLPLLFAQA